jgi:hypothetical protein
MTVESILERINQKPFRPIALQTVDKIWIKVDRESDIFIYDRMETACVVIFDPMRRKFVFTPEKSLQSKRGEGEENARPSEAY